MVAVLIIEDSKFIRAFITDILESSGFIVAGYAETVDEAVKVYKKTSPDIVTMDLVLGDNKSGIEGIKEILKVDPNAHILACSSLGQEMLRAKVLETGASGFIVKPFKKKKFLEEIEKLIKLKNYPTNS